METIEKKLTRKSVSDLLKWSSSRYNDCTKKKAVDEIMNGMMGGGLWILTWADNESIPQDAKTRPCTPLNGMDRLEYLITQREYQSGTYCPGSSMTRYGTYQVDFEAKRLVDEDNRIAYQFILL